MSPHLEYDAGGVSDVAAPSAATVRRTPETVESMMNELGDLDQTNERLGRRVHKRTGMRFDSEESIPYITKWNDDHRRNNDG